MIRIDETRVSNYDYPQREEYLELVDNTSDLSEGSKDLLKKLFAEQSHDQYASYPSDLILTNAEKGHMSDLSNKLYIETLEDEFVNGLSNHGDRFTWVTILLNGEVMEI
jgi:hypothetical protein